MKSILGNAKLPVIITYKKPSNIYKTNEASSKLPGL